MDVKLATGNRITIPKSVLSQTTYKSGDIFDLSILSDGSLLLCPKSSSLDNKLNKLTDRNDSVKSIKPKSIKCNGIKIVSNLAEGEHFSTKYYSTCGLVIRTKNKYLNKFCEACRR